MDFRSFSLKFANKIGGKYEEYDDNHSIFVVPLPDDRFQTVIAKLSYFGKYDCNIVQITSKVCESTENIDYPKILEASKDFIHTNFIVEDGFLKVDSSVFLDHSDEKLISEAILEVAYTADEWEFKITGKDIF